MRRRRLPTVGLVLSSLMVMGIAMTAAAQDVRARIGSVDLRTVRTPQFRNSQYGSQGSRHDWLQINLQYETEVRRGEWTDELTIDWYVLVRPGDRRPMLLKESVTYADVKAGKHNAVIYVRPGFVQRYTGQRRPKPGDFAVYVEISVAGSRLARAEESRGSQPEGWWQAGTQHVTLVENELLPRTETPFAHIDYDYYEHIKPKRR